MSRREKKPTQRDPVGGEKKVKMVNVHNTTFYGGRGGRVCTSVTVTASAGCIYISFFRIPTRLNAGLFHSRHRSSHPPFTAPHPHSLPRSSPRSLSLLPILAPLVRSIFANNTAPFFAPFCLSFLYSYLLYLYTLFCCGFVNFLFFSIFS